MKSILVLIAFCVMTLGVSAQPQNKIGVKLTISGRTGLENQVRSYFTREFRTIGDVDVNDDQALLCLDIVIMEVKNKGGRSIGYAMSLVITDRTAIVPLVVAGTNLTTDTAKQLQIVQLMPKDGILVDHILQTLDPDSLPATCKALASQIDGGQIERVRKQVRELQKATQSPQKK
jgi:hypothetical protein